MTIGSASVRSYGPHAWLVDDLEDPSAWARGLRRVLEGRADPDGFAVVDVVPAERSVLVVGARGRCDRVPEILDAVVADPMAASTTTVEIPVVYDGPDLPDVADATGCAVSDVIARHHRGHYRSAFCGFSPGFSYLIGLDPALVLPRRATPRPRVPAGSVAIAAHYTAIYPSDSPGGWHLIGRTSVPMWELDRDPPARLPPGARVRFVPVGA